MRHEDKGRNREQDDNNRKRVSDRQDLDVDYLMERCNCSRDKVLNAIEKVGHSRAKLEEFLKKNNTGRPR